MTPHQQQERRRQYVQGNLPTQNGDQCHDKHGVTDAIGQTMGTTHLVFQPPRAHPYAHMAGNPCSRNQETNTPTPIANRLNWTIW